MTEVVLQPPSNMIIPEGSEIRCAVPAGTPLIVAKADKTKPDPIVPAVFEPEARTEPCTSHNCANGHGWPIKFAIIKCPGCAMPTLAVQLANCPVCNEPPSVTTLRVDFTTNDIGVPPQCKGIMDSRLESYFVDIPRATLDKVKPEILQPMTDPNQ